MIRFFTSNTVCIAAALLLSAGCSVDYEVGDNNASAGNAMNPPATGGQGGTGAVSNQSGRIVDFPCNEWGKGVEMPNRQWSMIHEPEFLGNKLWATPETIEGAEATGVYWGYARTSGDMYCIAQHMLRDARSRDGLALFFAHWLGFHSFSNRSVPPVFDDYPNEHIELLADQAIRFAVDQMLMPGAEIDDLFSGNRPFTLAPEWGSETPTDAQRNYASSGLLSEPAIMAKNGDDVVFTHTMGGYLRETFLCQSIPPPPPEAQPSGAKPEWQQGEETVRQMFTRLGSSSPTCNACHSLFAPLGLPFDVFDGVGRIRRYDSFGYEFELASVPPWSTAAPSYPITDIRSVANYLGDHASFKPCFATALYRYLKGEPSPSEEYVHPDEETSVGMALPDNDSFKDLVASVVRRIIEEKAQP